MNLKPDAIKDHNFILLGFNNSVSIFQCSNCKIKLLQAYSEKFMDNHPFEFLPLYDIIKNLKYYYYYPIEPLGPYSLESAYNDTLELYSMSCGEIRIRDIIL